MARHLKVGKGNIIINNLKKLALFNASFLSVNQKNYGIIMEKVRKIIRKIIRKMIRKMIRKIVRKLVRKIVWKVRREFYGKISTTIYNYK